MVADLADIEPVPQNAEPQAPGAFDDFEIPSVALLTGEPEPAKPTEPAKPDEPAATTADEPAATDTDDDDFPDEPPTPGSGKAQKGWKEIKSDLKKTRAELRAERDKAAAEIKARDEELAKLREQVAVLPEVSEKAKYAEEAEKELAIARVEGSREYKETVKAPLDTIAKAAKELAKANEIKPEDLLDALSEEDPAKRRAMLKDVISTLDVVDQHEVLKMAEDTQRLFAKADEMHRRATEARKELEEIETKRQTETRQKARREFEGAVDHTVAELKKRIPFVQLAEGETADAVFAAIIKDTKASDPDTAEMSTKAFAAVSAIALKRVNKQLVHLIQENKTLKERIAGDNASRPSVGGGSPPAPSQATGDDDDFTDITARHLGLRVSRTKLE